MAGVYVNKREDKLIVARVYLIAYDIFRLIHRREFVDRCERLFVNHNSLDILARDFLITHLNFNLLGFYLLFRGF